MYKRTYVRLRKCIKCTCIWMSDTVRCKFDLIPLVFFMIKGIYIYLTAQRPNSNTFWFNFQTYIIFSINLVSHVALRSSGTDILYGCHLLRCLYNILYFLWLYDDFFIILYNILKIAELDCCQIIILSIYLPYLHTLRHISYVYL